MLAKLLGIASVGGTIANVAMLQHFLSGMINAVTLAVVTAFMCCVLFTVGTGAAYLMLVHYGLDPYVAALTLFVPLAIITMVFVILTTMRIEKLRSLPYHRLYEDVPALSSIVSVIDAFADGLLNGSRDRH